MFKVINNFFTWELSISKVLLIVCIIIVAIVLFFYFPEETLI